VSNELFLVAFIMVHLAFAAFVIIQGNRTLAIAYVVLSLLTTIVLWSYFPVLAALRFILWVIALRYFITLYNTLVVFANNIDLAINGVRVAITRRLHILPRAERYVADYTRHERETFRETVQARGGARYLLALAERYPDLRASRTFQTLLAELVDAENQVYGRRIAFNESVRAYNAYLAQFPNVLVGRAMGFRKREYDTPEQHT
jgi:LemA protein